MYRAVVSAGMMHVYTFTSPITHTGSQTHCSLSLLIIVTRLDYIANFTYMWPDLQKGVFHTHPIL